MVAACSGENRSKCRCCFFHKSGLTGPGIVVRNMKGEVVIAARRVVFKCDDAVEAELLACRKGLNLASQ
jgi:hypothetical protein